MKTQSLVLAALAAVPSALAHTVWTNFYVDGVDQGDGVAMRMRKDDAKASFPLEDYNSDNMACNVDGTTGVPRVQSVSDGSTLTFEMRSWPDDPSKEPLDKRHYGPCALYLKKVDSAIEDKGAGDGWFKLFDNGYDASTNEWCTDRLIANNGRLSVKLPKGLQGGYYLARPEVLALHNATDGNGQFYAGCAQIFLQSSGNLVPESTVSIPGYVKFGEPSVKFNIYENKNAEYKVPGPPVAKLTASNSIAGTSDGQTTQTEGQRPAGVIAENANWFGTEVPSYSDEPGCWASSEKCWKEADDCFKSAPPTGHSGCKLFQDKCQGIVDACNSKDFNGPPNKGKDLTPKPKSIDVGLIMPTVGGGVDDAPNTKATQPSTMATTAAEAKPTKDTEPVAAPSANTDVSSAKPTQAPAPPPAYPTKPKPKTTLTVPASENAPAPTAMPTCPKGYECVTVTEVEMYTVTEVVTLPARRRRSVHQRRFV